MNRMRSISVACLLFISVSAYSQVRLPALISDNAVLQRNTEIRLFGTATPGELVTMLFAGNTMTATTGADGKWAIILPAQKAGGPYDITFKASNEVTVRNVLFGDVWVCSGQSNMELAMDRLIDKYATEISRSENSQIRYFDVPDRYNFKEAQTDIAGGKWISASPSNVLTFSAVAYFFARDLYEKYHIPIGLVNASLGGSPAESWLSEEALRKFPQHLAEAKRFRDDQLISEIEESERMRSQAWYAALAQTETGSRAGWHKSELDDAGWDTVSVPGYFDGGNGSVWFRKKFRIDGNMRGRPGVLHLGRVVDQDSVFINGKFVGTTSYQYPPRRYKVPADLLVEGENSIVIRVISQAGKGGFVPDKKYLLALGNDTIRLDGLWKYRRSATTGAAPGQTFIRWKPLGLYNGMIAPLQQFPVTGVIWYQGESNTARAEEYSTLFPALIQDWRSKWGFELPFLYVQLANFMEKRDQPEQSNWAELREAQRNTLSVKKTGMAVAIDAGEWNDIHPFSKKEIGERLALLARKIAYGEKKLVASGPSPQKWLFEGNKVVVEFADATGGVVVRGNPPQMAISGDGIKFIWARQVDISSRKITVSDDRVPKPVVVRYGWADNPTGATIYNKSGLPATPFEIKRESPSKK